MKCKCIIMDVDGTLTDGKIYMGSSGEVIKAFNIKDGLGIRELLPEYGIIPVIITGRKSEILETRARELEIKELYQGIGRKTEKLNDIIKKMNITYQECAYIGDDINDLDCIKLCGYTGCPADSSERVKEAVDYICENKGGNGAVREFIEKIISIQ